MKFQNARSRILAQSETADIKDFHPLMDDEMD